MFNFLVTQSAVAGIRNQRGYMFPKLSDCAMMEMVLVKASFAYFENSISKQFFLLVCGIFQHALQFNTDIDKRVGNFSLLCISDDPSSFVSVTLYAGAVAVLVLFTTQTDASCNIVCLCIFFIYSLTLFNIHISSIS
jgi:hypothetical protein